jgi:hypothetical protein
MAPKIRNFYKFEGKLGGGQEAPFADKIYALVRRQDGYRTRLDDLEKDLFKYCTIEVDERTSSGFSVQVTDKEKLESLQRAKQNLREAICQIDSQFDEIDNFLEGHPEVESCKCASIRNRANYFRQMVYDKCKPFQAPGYPLQVPKKLQAELDGYEAQAKHLEAIADKIEELARER